MFRCNVGRASLRQLRRGNASAVATVAHQHQASPRCFLSSPPSVSEIIFEEEALSSRLPMFSKTGGASSSHHGLSIQATETISSLQCPKGASLPNVMYLYDDKGSALFEKITKTPEYYLTEKELSILEENSDDIARFPDEPMSENLAYTRHFQSLLIELGAGSGRKMRPILDATARIPSSKFNRYIPVDCSAGALDENINDHNRPHERRLSVEPFHGTNDEALQALCLESGRKSFLFLGSSLGNFVDAIPFLREIRKHMGLRDRLLIGLDSSPSCPSNEKSVDAVNAAYNDAQGITESFILNALSVANRTAFLDFDEDDWRMSANYDYDTEAVQIYTECVSRCDVHHTRVDGTRHLVRAFIPGDRIFIEQSGKFSLDRVDQLSQDSGLFQSRAWSSRDGYFCIHEFLPDPFHEATQMNNFIMRGLVGTSNLSTRPLPLRNPWAFYWGHIPAFADRVAVQLLGREEDRVNFERGIDPDVDDPTKVHRHSSCLEEWPSHTEYEAYDKEVEAAMKAKVQKSGMTSDVLMAIEHTDMHHETLMYMGNESPHVRYAPHPFAPFQSTLDIKVRHNVDIISSAVIIPKQNVCLGAGEQLSHEAGFTWDNEVPETPAVTVNEFTSSTKPVTNAEFAEFFHDGGYRFKEFWVESNEFAVDVGRAEDKDDDPSKSWTWVQKHDVQMMPVMWEVTNKELGNKGSLSVRTLCDGPVSFEEGSCEWPAMVTLYEAKAFCRWQGDGSRIMTELEYQAHFTDDSDFKKAAYNGNNNWKYRGFVPVGSMDDSTGYGCHDLVGNGWEWTTSIFEEFPNFQPLPIYPEYSTDFFDGKHYVLKGAGPFSAASYTRRSFRNFFQPNYRHCMAKFRLCW